MGVFGRFEGIGSIDRVFEWGSLMDFEGIGSIDRVFGWGSLVDFEGIGTRAHFIVCFECSYLLDARALYRMF